VRYTLYLGLLALVGCSGDDLTLVVDLRTDLTPGIEFFTVDTRLDGERLETTGFLLGQSVFEGRRIAEYGGLGPGTHTVDVDMLDATGTIATRRVVVELRESTGITVLITRDCAGVTCPGSGDDGSATQCHGGRCVADSCAPEVLDDCGDAECTVDGDCPPGPTCAASRCVAGTCLLDPDDGRCGTGERCDVVEGCVALPDVDAGPMDTGPMDTGPMDTGPADTGPADTGPADTSVPDVLIDTGTPDAAAGAICDAVFGGEPSYMRCTATATTCEFYTNPDGDDCATICSFYDEACLAAYGESGPTMVCTRSSKMSCFTAFADAICVCTITPDG